MGVFLQAAGYDRSYGYCKINPGYRNFPPESYRGGSSRRLNKLLLIKRIKS
jgi:hypothetical protein